MTRRFFSRRGYAFHFCWSDLVITKNFCNAGFLDPPLFCSSSMEVRLNGCLTTCHPDRLLRKTINCSILNRFALLMPTLSHWPGDSPNYAHYFYPVKLSAFMKFSPGLIISRYSYRFSFFVFVFLFL